MRRSSFEIAPIQGQRYQCCYALADADTSPLEKGRVIRILLEEMWSALEQASVRDFDPDTIEQFIATSGNIRRAIVERDVVPPPDDPRPEGRTCG